MRWLKFSFIPLLAGILLLITGASPVLGVPAVFRSGVMLLIGVIIGLLSLYAAFKTRKRHWGLFILHAGVVFTLLGGFLDFFYERKVSFPILVGENHISNIVYDQQTEERHDLTYTFCVRSFAIEYYPYNYSIYKLKEGSRSAPTFIANGIVKDEKITFPQTDVVVEPDIFVGDEAYHILDKKYVIMRTRTEKFFRADFQITDGDKTFDEILAVNHPVDYHGWKFYLVSHGLSQGNQYVYLTAKHAPGVPFAHTGFWLLIIGTFAFGLIQRKPKS